MARSRAHGKDALSRRRSSTHSIAVRQSMLLHVVAVERFSAGAAV